MSIYFFFFNLQSILNYNGGCVVAMRGKNCVAIATDLRFGVQGQTIATDFEVNKLLLVDLQFILL